MSESSLVAIGQRAKAAGRLLAKATTDEKNAALRAIADGLDKNRAKILDANVLDVQDGKFHGGDAVYGLSQGGVGLGKISPKVPRSEVAAVNRIKALLTAGKIVPPRTLAGN